MSPHPTTPPIPANWLEPLLEQLAEQVAERTARKLRDQLAPERQATPWLSTETAAAHLGWPKQRLYKLAAAGAIPHYKQEGRLLFHRGELDDWLHQFASGERAGTSAPGTELC
jgi:excisionase family DNA binding protein